MRETAEHEFIGLAAGLAVV